MDYASEGLIAAEARRARRTQFSVWMLVLTPALALLIQVYLPLFESLRLISRIELPLLVTIYFGLMRHSQIRGLTLGLLLGLAQDSFSRYYIGMYGICKTMVGYLAASIGMQFDVESPLVRFLICGLFLWLPRVSVLGSAARTSGPARGPGHTRRTNLDPGKCIDRYRAFQCPGPIPTTGVTCIDISPYWPLPPCS